MQIKSTSETGKYMNAFHQATLSLSADQLAHIAKVAALKPIGRDAANDLRELGLMVQGKYELSESGKKFLK